MSNPEIFEEWYCGFCGTAKKKNTVVNKKAGDRLLTCTDCNIVIRFYIQSPATKTVAEAVKSFEAVPLTDSQRYGGTTRGKKRKKKKKK